jgi:hypothetical protein
MGILVPYSGKEAAGIFGDAALGLQSVARQPV